MTELTTRIPNTQCTVQELLSAIDPNALHAYLENPDHPKPESVSDPGPLREPTLPPEPIHARTGPTGGSSASAPKRPPLPSDDDGSDDDNDGSRKLRKGKTLLKEPFTFDGDKTRYREWKRKLLAWIKDPHHKARGNSEKIAVAMSYIEGPNVQEWSENTYQTFYDENMEKWVCTWDKFKELMDEQWLDSAAIPSA